LSEATDLLEEIFEYIQHKFDPEKAGEITLDIKAEGTMITLYAYHEKKIILEKRMLFLINKYDLVNDKEVLKEYETQLKEQIITFFKNKKC
jgi:hypothetical protein